MIAASSSCRAGGGGARTIRWISGRWSRRCWNFFQLEIPEGVKPSIPGMNICRSEVKIQGRLCRTAHLDADGYKFLDDPEEIARNDSEVRLSNGMGQHGCLEDLHV